jgi:hypothetical protein
MHETIGHQADIVAEEATRYQPVKILIEKVGLSTLDEWVLNKYTELAGLVQVTTPRVSKAARLAGVTPLLESGVVVFSDHLNPASPTFDHERGNLVGELIDFPFAKHDDMCLAAGTMIATLRGDIPIEQVRAGDWVITPLGVAQVTEAGQTGVARTIRRHGLDGTHGHHVFAHGNGWPRMDALTQAVNLDRLTLWNLLKWCGRIPWTLRVRSSSMASPISSWEARDVITSASHGRTQDGGEPRACMWRSGRLSTVRSFRAACSCIIETATRSTTILGIWSVYRVRTMLALLGATRRANSPTLSGYEAPLPSGTAVQMAAPGTASMRVEPSLGNPSPANTAASPSMPAGRRGFVRRFADMLRAALMGTTTGSKSAPCVERNSPPSCPSILVE